jgi:rhodanese-related sulfurtransferase
MSKKFKALLGLLILLSMILGACAPAAAPVAEEPQAPAVEEPVVVEEPVEKGPSLDDTFGAMLTEMVSYNTVKADALMAELAEDKPPFLLDVRTTEELQENGYIEGATHIPLNELAQHTDLLPGFDTPIVAYCGSGWRATIAMTALHGMGWTDVRALKATFADWKSAGNPVAEGVPEAIALNAASPDAALVAAADAYLVGIMDKGDHYGIITAEGLNTALAENPDLVILDVRTQAEVDEKGVVDAPNLINIPLQEFVTRQAEWPAKNSDIAVYCGSGHRSTMAMSILYNYGYENVTSLKSGFAAWKDAGYATVGGIPTLADNYKTMLTEMVSYNTIKADGLLVELAEDKPPFLLDVRSTAELEENGYIEGATNIPLNELAQHLDLLPSFDTPIVTYCGSGWRATIAMTALHAMGWTNVRALKTAFADWVAAGNPVVQGLPEAMALDAARPVESIVASVDPAMVAVKEMGWGVKPADALNVDLVEKPGLIVIDVRTPEEIAEKGVIAVEGQEFLTIPLESFLADKALWPADKDADIVVYCGSGHRSTMAMTILLTEGYTNVTSLKGGFGGWVEASLPVAEYAAQ